MTVQIRRILARAAAAVAAASILTALAQPAGADAATGNTTTTFVVTGGSLAVTVPATANLGSGAPGTNISAQLGSIQVTDARALLTAAWTGSATTTTFTTGGATAPETIAKSAVSYWSGAATATTGSGTFTPGQANAGAAQAMGSSVTAFSVTGGVGNNSVTWDPTLIVAAPAAAVGGTYTGTVTHSVA